LRTCAPAPRSGQVAPPGHRDSATIVPHTAPAANSPTMIAGEMPAAACPAATTVKINNCSPAVEALLPAVLINTETAATSTTVTNETTGRPTVTIPRQYPTIAAVTAPASRRAR